MHCSWCLVAQLRSILAWCRLTSAAPIARLPAIAVVRKG
jgi:hypothetical protein